MVLIPSFDCRPGIVPEEPMSRIVEAVKSAPVPCKSSKSAETSASWAECMDSSGGWVRSTMGGVLSSGTTTILSIRITPVFGTALTPFV